MKRVVGGLVPLLFSATFLSSPALALDEGDTVQDQRSEVAEDKNAIVITGARTQLPVTALPLTVDVLGDEALTDQLVVSGSTADALAAAYPAFSPTREKLSNSGETLRGRSPLFAINGVPQSTPIRDGSRDSYTIDPFFIDRVEVIYGSNALQGIGATGGVVNQVTVSPPREEGFSARTLLQGTAQDGFDGSELGGKTAGLIGYRDGEFDMVLGLSGERRGAFIDAEGRRIGVDGTQGEIQDSDSWSIFGSIGYDIAPDVRVSLTANRFFLEGNGNYILVPGDRDAGIPATSKEGEIDGAPPSNRAELVSAELTHGNLGGGALTAQAFYSLTRDIFGGGIFGTFQDPSIDPSGQLFDQSTNRSRKLGGKLFYERALPGFDQLVMSAGVDLLHDRTAQTLLQTGRTWVPQSDYSSIAPFLQGNLALADEMVRVVGGVRREHVTLDVPDFTSLASYGSRQVDGGSPSFDETLFNAGVIIEPLDGLRAYGSYAEGFTIADVGRILRGIDTDGVDVDNFLDLEPVISNNRELGAEWERGVLTAHASYWWSSSDLGSRLVRNADGIFEVTRAPIELEGVDLGVEVDLDSGFSVSAAYAMTKGRTDSDDNGTLDADLDGANISPDRINLHAGYATGPFDAGVAVRFHLKREFEGQDPRNNFEGYTLVDAHAGYEFGKNRLIFGIANLLDEQYLTYYSDTQGPTDNSRFFAGRGRTFTLALTSAF